MSVRTALLGAVIVAGALTGVPVAAAQPCPDVEVVFARGTTEPPGVGGTGQAFVDALRDRLDDRSMRVYAVAYPADHDFQTSTPAGAADAAARVRAVAASCPETRIVLGGFSQGAAVVDLATNQLPPELADHVAAIVDFGGPRSGFADTVLARGRAPRVAPAFAPKALDLCVPHDPICFDGGFDMNAHNSYIATGLVQQGAAFAAERLG
ncbi:cutinase family protein [uncultured Mycolicibacterium sp.]|uniref:cutinase family protein n=1 Tax=uncultured Mycolicibacterium sp. TaxID=2320817 RepID=UPI00262F66C0|nr:cutinase family protein [uncultured Mycolicibacterium sp.]